MMNKLRDEEGVVLASAVILLTVILGLGLGLLFFTDNQQKASASEQASEVAFNVAEAALNAQIGQVSRNWPASGNRTLTGGAELVPQAGCTAVTTTAANDCPSAESMKVGYPAGTCPSGGPKDAWGSPASNEWTTYVRDDAEKNTSFFNSTTEKLQPSYDANEDNKLWVRAVGIVNCRLVSLVSLVSRQEIASTFPKTMMSANYFETGNNGNGSEPIVEGRNPENVSEPGEIRMRCSGFSNVSECEKYRSSQIENAKVNPPPGAPSPTVGKTEMLAYMHEAETLNTYYPTGKCPTGLPVGKIVYVEGPCAVTGGGTEIANSSAHPGFLIIANGTFSMGGSAQFFGVVYDANKQGSSGIVVKIGANANLHGEINVDGNGGIEVGENHNKNLEYDPRAAVELKIYVGATPTRNTFRVLPVNE
jgi:Tfp pilus assembly protein PilX